MGFNNMLPVHKDALIELNIDAEPDRKYRELLKRQAALCNRMKADILAGMILQKKLLFKKVKMRNNIWNFWKNF